MRLTRINSGDDTGAREVALARLAAMSLVICVHGIGCTGSNIVWGKACTPGLNGLAIDSLGTCILKVGLELSIGGLRLWHTPLLAGVRTRLGWFSWLRLRL